MKKDLIAIGVIIIVAVSAIAAFVVFTRQLIPDQWGFQFEREVTATTPDRILFRVNAEDTDLSISFVDNTDRLYSIDVTPYENSTEAHIGFDMQDDSWMIMFTTGQQESVDIILGNGCFYYVQILGSSYLNTTIVYSNNSWVNGTAFSYTPSSSSGFEGHLTLKIQDDIVTDGTTGFEGQITCTTLNLEIDVPDQWGGVVNFYDSNVTFIELTGWFEWFGRYMTDNSDDDVALIDLEVHVEEVLARLVI
ncbi:MAG: hypothetical protein ACFFEE_13520 [Candidatus Thorarchaeota archaeon]